MDDHQLCGRLSGRAKDGQKQKNCEILSFKRDLPKEIVLAKGGPPKGGYTVHIVIYALYVYADILKVLDTRPP